MNKMLLALSLAVGLAGNADAGSFDSKLNLAWDEISASENFHLLDNGKTAYFYDIMHGEQFGGIASTFYEKGYFAIDAGVIKTTEVDRPGFPLVGGNILLGKLALKSEIVGLVTSLVGYVAPLLKSATFGAWAARDYHQGVWRTGFYGGLSKKF